ncbi:DMT family transporter [Magnetospirillum moscoviense]|uniref:Multidrug DMT transporter permease n=1 Tax=Magnetospirillum moscoviense TaxID=1437059 RepID=A0A178N1Y4_9PROT|nr:EamA family transporter [Magnetospirillum moscoviense]OAN67604.1 multidrug DMT transporter permease [Magnetospirillum moscoviense]
MNLKDGLTALVVVTLWGLNFIAVKVALTVLSPFLLCSLRFFLVALLTVAFFRPQAYQLPRIAGLALVLGVGHFGLLFWGVAGMDAATAAIVTQLGVPFSVLLAWAFFGDRLGLRRGAGLVAAFSGVALLAGEPQLPATAPLVVAVIAMAAWAVSNIQVKKLGDIHPLALNGWMGLMTAPLLAGISLATESGQGAALAAMTWPVVAAVAYTTIGSSLVAYTLWYRLVSRHDLSRLVPITLLGPVIGVAGGVLALGEVLTWQKVVGGAITVAGVALVQLAGQRGGERVEPGP